MDDINLKQVRITILGIFAIIVGVLIWYLNTDYHVKKDYLKFRNKKINSTIYKKVESRTYGGNQVYLKNGGKLHLYKDIFIQLRIGDSVAKKVQSDSIFFFTANGIIINDYNHFKRKKYLKTLKDP